MPKNRSRNVQNNSRNKKLELENQAFRSKLKDLEKILVRFVNRSKNVNMTLGRQRPRNNKSALGY